MDAIIGAGGQIKPNNPLSGLLTEGKPKALLPIAIYKLVLFPRTSYHQSVPEMMTVLLIIQVFQRYTISLSIVYLHLGMISIWSQYRPLL